jgi:hypothetical protein
MRRGNCWRKPIQLGAATRYPCRSGFIRIRGFVFVSTKDREVLAFTADQAGANPPPDYAPSKPATHGGAVLHGDYPDDDADVVLEAVRSDGFFLAGGGNEDEGLPRRTAH